MNYPIYSHDANPNVDRKLCRKSRAYCDDLVLKGEAYWLPNHSGLHLFAPVVKAAPGAKQKDCFGIKSVETNPAISARENRLNSEYVASVKRNLPAVQRAHEKFKAWPTTADTKAVRVNPRV